MSDTKERRLVELEKAYPGHGRSVARLIDFASAEAARGAARLVRSLAEAGRPVSAKAILGLARTLDDVAEELER